MPCCAVVCCVQQTRVMLPHLAAAPGINGDSPRQQQVQPGRQTQGQLRHLRIDQRQMHRHLRCRSDLLGALRGDAAVARCTACWWLVAGWPAAAIAVWCPAANHQQMLFWEDSSQQAPWATSLPY